MLDPPLAPPDAELAVLRSTPPRPWLTVAPVVAPNILDVVVAPDVRPPER